MASIVTAANETFRQQPKSLLGSVAAVKKEGASDSIINLEKFYNIDGACRGKIVRIPAIETLDAVVIDDVLSAEECAYLINATEEEGYTFWKSNATEEAKQFRTADTVEVKKPSFAKLLWERVRPFVNASVNIAEEEDFDDPKWQRDVRGTWEGEGTVDLILFARYKPGGHFSPHTDGSNIDTLNRRSFYTMILYLNDCQGGGETKFYDLDQRDSLLQDAEGRFTGDPGRVLCAVRPRAGRALIFAHELLHEGAAVHPGCQKYIIRSDIMYKRTPPVCASPRGVAAFQLYQKAQELSNDGDCAQAATLFRRAFKLSPQLADIYGA